MGDAAARVNWKCESRDADRQGKHVLVHGTPTACLTRDFEEFLHAERGLSQSTAISYLPIVRRLLDERFGRKALRIEQLRPQDLHGFILRETRRVSRSHGKGVVTALMRPESACRHAR